MCGIVGLYARHQANDNHLKLLQHLLYLDQIRGEHATGLAKVDLQKNSVKVIKKAVDAGLFLADPGVREFMAKERVRLWIGHNRYATMGNRDEDANAHPFTADHITMVHNGTVNKWTLSGLEGFSEPDVVVDSHMVAKTIAALGAKEAITKKLSGAFALVWYDSNERSLNFIRNKERPLFLASLGDSTLVWASEKRFLDFLIDSPKCPFVYANKGEPELLPEDTLFTYYFNEHGALTETKPRATVMSFHKSVNPTPVTNRGSSNGYYDEDGYPWFSGVVGGDRQPTRREVRAAVRQAHDRPSWEESNRKLLEKHGVGHLSIGGNLRFEWCRWTPYTTAGPNAKGTLIGKYGTKKIEVRSFQVVHEDLQKDTQWLTGKIDSCFESQGELVICATIQPEKAEVVAPTQKKPEGGSEGAGAKPHGCPPVIRLDHWPLKVDGFTFNNRLEFEQVVGKGCLICSKTPMWNNIFNKHISIDNPEGFGTNHLRLNQLDFICGRCNVGDDEVEKILERHNAV